jgi:hypothetical protein
LAGAPISRPAPRRPLGDHDLALGGEVLGEIDQLRLRLVDVAQPHRAHLRHVVGQHLGGAGRHVAEEELAHRVAGALERDAELVLVDLAHQRLRRAGVEPGEVVEGEHQGLDALGAFAVVVLKRGHEAGFGLAVEIVEDFRHHLVGVAAPRLRQVRHEFGAQRVLDPLDHLLLHRFHPQHAVDHVEREVLGQDGEHARGMLGPQLGEHHRHGLRVFVLEIVGEHLLLDVGELLPHVAARRTADLLHDAADPLRRQILLQQPLGRVVGAHHRARGRHARDEFQEQAFDRRRLDGAERRHHHRELAQLVVVEQAPDLGAVLLAERQHEHGGALRTGELAAGILGLAARQRGHHAGDFPL